MTNVRLVPIRRKGLTWTAIGLCTGIVLLLGFATTPDAAGPANAERPILASAEHPPSFLSYTTWLAAAHAHASTHGGGGELADQF